MLYLFWLWATLIATCLAQSSTSTSSTAAATATPTVSISTLPSLVSLPALNLSSPAVVVDLPESTSLYITLNICSLSSNDSLIPTARLSIADPASFVLGTRSVKDQSSGGSSANPNRRSRSGSTWNVAWTEGFANWTVTDSDDALSAQMLIGLGLSDTGIDTTGLTGDGNVVVQLGVSGDKPLHAISPQSPFFGDSTADSAMIFSPLLLVSAQTQPTYPNYTLPLAQMVFPSYSSAASSSTGDFNEDVSVIVVPTSNSPTTQGLGQSQCAVQAANTTSGRAGSETLIYNTTTPQWTALDSEEGFRTTWVVGQLDNGATNYTAFVVDSEGTMSQPMWFTTKEADFPCQLLLPTSYCPSVAYAAPLPVNSTPAVSPLGNTISITSPVQSLPDTLANLITQSLNSFSVSLGTTACGRDYYSHVSSCLDCYTAYRDWVCRVTIPRCTSPTTANSSASSSVDSDEIKDAGYRPPVFAVNRTSDNPRMSALADVYTYDYTELLPCLSSCNAADRACPATLLFRCPQRSVSTANQSYGFYGDDNDVGDGSSATGILGSDLYGNSWCNGP